jgi:type I restriction enzyme S subunit
VRINIPLPPSDEQGTISWFLDLEVAKIDALIAEQERLIELLKEKRQAIISQAVTKGLNAGTPLKPSGVAGMGDIPVDWHILRIATLSTKITNGYVGPTRDILKDEGVRYLQSLHIKDGQIRFETPYFVSPEWSQQHAKSILQGGDVLIVQTGDIGQVAVVPEAFSGCNCHALIIVAPKKSSVMGGWIAAVLRSDYGRHSLLSIQTGALHPHLNCSDVRDVRIPVPPISVQRSILDYTQRTYKSCQDLIQESSKGIELLRERRSALVTAAVTGQIDVRGLVEQKAA